MSVSETTKLNLRDAKKDDFASASRLSKGSSLLVVSHRPFGWELRKRRIHFGQPTRKGTRESFRVFERGAVASCDK